MKIYKERAGVISENEAWCCLYDCYLYTADTLCKLIKIMITEWQDEKHLVG